MKKISTNILKKLKKKNKSSSFNFLGETMIKEFDKICKYPIQIDWQEFEFSFYPKENTEEMIKMIINITYHIISTR